MQRAIPVVAALLAGALGLLNFVRNIELQTYDLRVEATAHPSSPSRDIVLVAIDNESLRRMEPLVGRWPWPRLVHATVIDYLAAAGAKVIGYDVLFAERDIRKFMVGDTEWTGDESDAALVDSTKKAGNVVHIAEVSSPRARRCSRAIAVDLDCAGAQRACRRSGCVEPRPRMTPPFPALAHARARDRPFLVHLRHRRPAAPHLAGGAGRRSHHRVVCAGDAAGSGRDADGSMRMSATAALCGVMIPWRGPAENGNGQPTFTSYSFYDVFYSQQQVLEGQKPAIDPAIFKDRIVIVGATAEGLKDVFTTPFSTGRHQRAGGARQHH